MQQLAKFWLVLILLLTSKDIRNEASEEYAQSHEPDWIIGIWENAELDLANFRWVAFLPDGQIRIAMMEGMFYGSFRRVGERNVHLDLVSPGHHGIESMDGLTATVWRNGNHLVWASDEKFPYGPHTFRKIHELMPEAKSHCPDTLPSHIVKGFFGYVTYTDGSSSRLRATPSLSANVIMPVGEGRWFEVIGGPICAEGYTWWQVEIKDTHEVGWMAEGDDEYYIDLLPYTEATLPSIPLPGNQQDIVIAQQDCLGALPPRMVLNQQGRVTYTDGSSTNLRAAPASPSILLAMPEGYEFEVIGGPECRNGLNWWQLRTPDGLVGWSAEGSADTYYWIEPLAPAPSVSQPFDLEQSGSKNQEEMSCSSAFEPGTWVKFVRNPLDGTDQQYYIWYANPHFPAQNFDPLSRLSEYGMLYLVELVSCDGNIPLWEVENEGGGLRGYFPERDARNDHVYFRVTEIPEREFYSQYPGMLPLHWYCLLEGPGCGIGDADINPADGQWWCSNTERIGEDLYCGRIDLNDACRFIYGEVDGSPVRPIATQLDPNNPGSWQCQADQPIGTEANNLPTTGQGKNTQTVTVHNPLWDMDYEFEVDPTTCSIINGTEIVSNELSLFGFWLETAEDSLNRAHMAYAYLRPALPLQPRGYVEQFRENAERVMGEIGCRNARYQIGARSMDLSGIGNIAFGFYSERYNLSWETEDRTSNWEQGINWRSLLQFYDNEDDLVQRLVGHAIAIRVRSGTIPTDTLTEIAVKFNLR